MNAQIEEEAAAWLIDIRADEPDAATREQFAAWLRSSPEHVRAYLELVALWEDASLHDRARTLDVDALIELAHSESNVVEFDRWAGAGRAPASAPAPASSAAPAPAPAPTPTVASTSESPYAPSPRPVASGRLRYGFAIAATVAVLMVTAGAWLALTRHPAYATELGEQRSIRLVDGSSVELNALSRIRVRFSGRERAVDLLSGQALFRVAKDASRPFIVTSGDARVRAVGTQFDVKRQRSRTVVTVIEGRVAIVSLKEAPTGPSPTLPTPRTVEVAAGEQATVSFSAVPQPRRANVATAMAWTQKQLIFESTPLPDVAEEFNRFNTRQLVIASPSLADFRMSGTFSAVDPASLSRLLRFLRAQPDMEIAESGDRIVVTQK